MIQPRILGVDPGGMTTGLCLRQGDQVVAAYVAHRAEDETGSQGVGVGPRFLAGLDEVLAELVDEHGWPDVAAVEGVKRPNPHVNRRNGNAVIDPGPLLGAAIVLGWVLARFPGAILVPPGGNGSMPLLAYPAVLVSPRERQHGLNRVGGSSDLRHVRSAYDVAGAARMVARLRASKTATPQPR